MSICVPTRIQQVGIVISQSLVGQEVVAVSVERHEGHHVVTIVVANRGIGTWVAAPGRLVSPEPALIDAADVIQSTKKMTAQLFIIINVNVSSIQQQRTNTCQ